MGGSVIGAGGVPRWEGAGGGCRTEARSVRFKNMFFTPRPWGRGGGPFFWGWGGVIELQVYSHTSGSHPQRCSPVSLAHAPGSELSVGSATHQAIARRSLAEVRKSLAEAEVALQARAVGVQSSSGTASAGRRRDAM